MNELLILILGQWKYWLGGIIIGVIIYLFSNR